MAIFLKIFYKTFSIFLSVVILIFLIISIFSFFDTKKSRDFSFISGDKNSANIIAILELSGLIINSNYQFSSLLNSFVITPQKLKNYLEELNKSKPDVIIISINSPGGTVSASKNLYDIILDFKDKNEIEIIFHTNELLASGGYWAATSGDQIYASYGSVIGSIGVKGPDWFFYNNPTSISSGLFGNKVETEKGIEIYSNIAGKSKDIFNPFRKPTSNEINQLQNMVDEIYDEFVRIVSKERKIEIKILEDEIGALIYTSSKAKNLNLIDDQIKFSKLI